MKPLLDDYTRCYGQGCEGKNSCWRYLTIKVDPPGVVLRYSNNLATDGMCEDRIIYQQEEYQ
jgi:hypothetical protein